MNADRKDGEKSNGRYGPGGKPVYYAYWGVFILCLFSHIAVELDETSSKARLKSEKRGRACINPYAIAHIASACGRAIG
jgi:hypothetical protein